MSEPLQEAVVTCPDCGARSAVRMATNACQFFWDCPACGAVVRPKSGDCCVFCSYGDVPCPPVRDSGHGANPDTA